MYRAPHGHIRALVVILVASANVGIIRTLTMMVKIVAATCGDDDVES